MAWKLEGCAIFLVIFMMLFAIQISNASTTYNVGDSNGWTFGVSNWPNGKNFKVGDVLVFNYPREIHNVVIVNKVDYNNCNPLGKMFNSGKDVITLKKGTTYFICGVPGHCDGAQKIAITDTPQNLNYAKSSLSMLHSGQILQNTLFGESDTHPLRPNYFSLICILQAQRRIQNWAKQITKKYPLGLEKGSQELGLNLTSFIEV
ncbi:chemocyanin-like [Solanum tuberosum]|uniref:chemocyanin-like n=1 Tax=Solanum tuberosum TaxID=4113 RepID=UPI0003D24235|nr:PREDICTED: chemocyanin-like [Solanum tuberosum]